MVEARIPQNAHPIPNSQNRLAILFTTGRWAQLQVCKIGLHVPILGRLGPSFKEWVTSTFREWEPHFGESELQWNGSIYDFFLSESNVSKIGANVPKRSNGLFNRWYYLKNLWLAAAKEQRYKKEILPPTPTPTPTKVGNENWHRDYFSPQIQILKNRRLGSIIWSIYFAARCRVIQIYYVCRYVSASFSKTIKFSTISSVMWR